MCLRTLLLLVVVRLVWMKVTKTDFVDESESSLQHLDPSSPVTYLDVIESDINTLDEELNDITSKMKEHTVEAMADNTTETIEVIADAIRNNEVYPLIELSEENLGYKIEDILDMSKAKKEAKQVLEMEAIPQTIVNNIKISNLTEQIGEQSEEKKDDDVDVKMVKNENLSSKAVTEKLENNEESKEEIMESSKMNDEDQLTSNEITETNESNINTLDEELSDIKSKMKEHTLEAMADDTTETNEVIAEAIRTNEVYQLLEPSEEKMDDKMEDIFDLSEATKEAKQIPEMMVTPQTTVNKEKISKLTELTGEQSEEKKGDLTELIGEQSEEKKDDFVEVTNVNEKLSSEAVREKNNEKAINKIELLNEKEEIKDSSNANVEGELTSKEITDTNDNRGITIEETNDAIGITIEEMMEKKSAELLQELLEENEEQFRENDKIRFDSSTILDIIISEELSSASSALNSYYKLTGNSHQRIHQMEYDTKFIDEIKEEINFLEESMNKHANTLNLHMVDLERIKDENDKIESESKAEGWPIKENSVHTPLWIENFNDVVELSSGEFIRDHVHETWPSKDFENFENPIKVKNYKEENKVEEPKYSLRPKEGVDLWFPIHEEDLDDIPNENTADQAKETPDDELVHKEVKTNPNVKLLLKRTGFWKDDEATTAQKQEERSSWMILLVVLPMMLLVLMLAVLMGIIFLTKTDKKPTIFMKSLNLWGNDYDRMEISSIKEPKYNKMK